MSMICGAGSCATGRGAGAGGGVAGVPGRAAAGTGPAAGRAVRRSGPASALAPFAVPGRCRQMTAPAVLAMAPSGMVARTAAERIPGGNS
jgi:hypothetical protein